MNFRVQEIIKMIVPGAVLICCLYFLIFNLSDLETLLNKDYVSVYLVFLLVIIYVLGYFLDWFGSLFERSFYHFFSKPSLRLLNNSQANSKQWIKMVKYEEIADELCRKLSKSPHYPYDKKSAEYLFKAANYLKEKNSAIGIKEKLNEFYFYNIFSRNLAVSFLCSFVFYPILYTFHSLGVFNHIEEGTCFRQFNWSFLFVLPVFIMSIFRWREHAMYYTRYIFYSATEDILKP